MFAHLQKVRILCSYADMQKRIIHLCHLAAAKITCISVLLSVRITKSGSQTVQTTAKAGVKQCTPDF